MRLLQERQRRNDTDIREAGTSSTVLGVLHGFDTAISATRQGDNALTKITQLRTSTLEEDGTYTLRVYTGKEIPKLFDDNVFKLILGGLEGTEPENLANP